MLSLQVICAIEASVKSRRVDSTLRQALSSLIDCESVKLHLIEEPLRRAWCVSATALLLQSMPYPVSCEGKAPSKRPALSTRLAPVNRHQDAETGAPLSKGIVGFTALTGQVRNIADAKLCKYFDARTDDPGTVTTLCCPVCDTYGKRLAVLQVDLCSCTVQH